MKSSSFVLPSPSASQTWARPVAVIRRMFVTRAIGTALASTSPLTSQWRSMRNTAAVEKAKKVTSIRSPLHASTTFRVTLPIRMRFPSAMAGWPQHWSRYVRGDRADPLQLGPEQPGRLVGQRDHEQEEHDRRPVADERRPPAGQGREPGQAEDERQPFERQEARRRAGEPQGDGEHEDREPDDRPRAGRRRHRGRLALDEQVQGEEGDERAVGVFGVRLPRCRTTRAASARRPSRGRPGRWRRGSSGSLPGAAAESFRRASWRSGAMVARPRRPMQGQFGVVRWSVTPSVENGSAPR